MSAQSGVQTSGSQSTEEQIADIGVDIFQGLTSESKNLSRRETRGEIENTYAGNWGALSIDCSARDAEALAIALAKVYEHNPSAAKQAYSKAHGHGYRPEDVGRPRPANPTQIARVVVWLACNGWGGSGSDLNPAERWAKSEVRDRIAGSIPEVSALDPSERDTVEKVASFLRDLAGKAQDAAAAVEGAEKGAKREVARERAKRTVAGFDISTEQVVTGVVIAGTLWGLGAMLGSG